MKRLVENADWKPGKLWFNLSGNSHQRRKALRALKRKFGLTDVAMISTGYGRVYKVATKETKQITVDPCKRSRFFHKFRPFRSFEGGL